jgi:hypothetical protein
MVMGLGLRELGMHGKLFAGGLATGSGYVLAKEQSLELKCSLAARAVQVYRAIGVSNRLCDTSLRREINTAMESFECVMLSSPLFYGAYSAMHSSQYPLKQRTIVAIAQGFSGSARAFIPLIVFYGVGSFAIPKIKDVCLQGGMDKDTARNIAHGTVFLGAGPLPELIAETKGCHVPLQLGPAVIGTVAIAGRLGFGVLQQYRAVESKEGNSDFVTTFSGTTVMQHVVNGSMEAMKYQMGIRGIGNYLLSGSAQSGVFSALGSAYKVGGTGMQRLTFSWLWDYLTHQEKEEPAWVACGGSCTK